MVFHRAKHKNYKINIDIDIHRVFSDQVKHTKFLELLPLHVIIILQFNILVKHRIAC